MPVITLEFQFQQKKNAAINLDFLAEREKDAKFN